MTETATDPARWSPRLWGALVVLCGALFLDGLDVSMVGVALPSLGADLGLTTTTLQWVVSGYVLGYGALLLLGGRAADLLGRRRVFLVAIAVFAVASLLGGLVDDGTLLVVTRFVKGVSAAFTAPAGLSIITTTFAEGPVRNRALSVYTACGASGFSLGLILGGLMTEVGWRWTFLLPVPVAIAVLVAGTKLIPVEAAPARHRRRGEFDLPGAVLSTAALLLFVYAIVVAPEVGWFGARTLGTLALVAALLTAFVAVEARTPSPLLRLGILRNATLVRANLVGLTLTGSYVGFQFLASLYAQNLLGWSPLLTALAFLPGGLIVAFGGPRTGGLVNRFGAPLVSGVGLASFAVGFALFLRAGTHPDYLGVFLPTMLLLGTGFGLAYPALNIQATNGVADDEQGLASGLVQTAFQIGGALVLAVGTAVVAASGGRTATAAADVLASYKPALAVVAAIALAGSLLAFSGVRRRRTVRLPEGEPALAAAE